MRVERGRDEAGVIPGTIRVGGVSKSATKAPRAGIGREEKRGISTILLAHSGSIGAFVADLDNPPARTGCLCIRTWVTVLRVLVVTLVEGYSGGV